MYYKKCFVYAFFAMLFGAGVPSLALAQHASTDTLMKHVQELSSQRYDGRLAGSEGYDNAADYVVEVLKGYGIKSYEKKWKEEFEIECNEIESSTFSTYEAATNTYTLFNAGIDYVCAGMSGHGYANGGAVFCGYGLDAKAYSEYEGLNVRDKVVVVASGVPNFVPSNVSNQYSTLRDKARAAQRRGAIALVVVNMSETCRDNEVQCRIWNGDGDHLVSFPIIQVTRACAERLFAEEQMSVKQALDSMQSVMHPLSFALNKRYEVQVNTNYNKRAITSNVVGVLEGCDRQLRREYIVVGAHLDGLGMQGGTCLFPGADDNASGVAAVLECARLLTQQADCPRRSVIFAFFSGAESQFLGSHVFVSNFSPLRGIEAFVNAECIGSGDSISVMGNGQFPHIWEMANKLDSTNTRAMVHGYKTMPKGDAAAFAQVGIPSLVFSTLNGNRHAHVPSDIAENVNRNILTKSAELMYLTVSELVEGFYQGRSYDSKNIVIGHEAREQ